MSKEVMLIILGLIVAVNPFSGLPNSWDTIILSVAGLLIFSIALYTRWKNKMSLRTEGRQEDVYHESGMNGYETVQE